jgi:hypothetical protein
MPNSARVTTGAVPTLDLQRLVRDRVATADREARVFTPLRSDRALVTLYGASHDELAEHALRKVSEAAPARRSTALERLLERPNSPFSPRLREELRSRGGAPPPLPGEGGGDGGGGEYLLHDGAAAGGGGLYDLGVSGGVGASVLGGGGDFTLVETVRLEQPGATGAARPREAELRAASAKLRRASLESQQRKTRALVQGPGGSVGATASAPAAAATTAAGKAHSSRLLRGDYVFVISSAVPAGSGGPPLLPPGEAGGRSGGFAPPTPGSYGGGIGGLGSEFDVADADLLGGFGVDDGVTSAAAFDVSAPAAASRGGRSPSPGRSGGGNSLPLRRQVLRHQILPGKVYPGFGDFSPHAHAFRDRIPALEVGPSPHMSTTLRADPRRAFGRPGEIDRAATARIEAENAAHRRAEHPFLVAHNRVLAPSDAYRDPVDSAPDIGPVPGERERRDRALHRPFFVLPVREDALRTDVAAPWAAWRSPVRREAAHYSASTDGTAGRGRRVSSAAQLSGFDFASSSHWREPPPRHAEASVSGGGAGSSGGDGGKSAASPGTGTPLRPSPPRHPLMSPLRGASGLKLDPRDSRTEETRETQERHAARIRDARGPDPSYLLPLGAGRVPLQGMAPGSEAKPGAFNINLAEFAASGRDPLALASRARDPRLKQSLRLSAGALQSSEHHYADPVRESEFEHTPFRDGAAWQRALLQSAGRDHCAMGRTLASAGGPGPGGASVLGASGLRLPLGSLGGALATMEVDAALAETMHAARAPAPGVAVGLGTDGVAAAAFSQHPLHGMGWRAANEVAGLPGMAPRRSR